jgi:hypothetical protein
MTSKEFVKINDIINCNLTLEDGTDFTIPMREDGYIYATKLCHVGGKDLSNWLRMNEVKILIRKIQSKIDIEKVNRDITEHNIEHLAIEIFKGNTSKYQQGTWIHPDLGIHLAQWINPAFALQVSKWVRELIITDEVKLGQEKTDTQIIKHYETLIQELNEKIERSENTIISITNECKYLLQKYRKINDTHRSYLRRKELYKLKEGACIYLINMVGLNEDSQTVSKIKIGFTGDITNRVSGYRTSNPFCKLLYLAYTHENILVERCMKKTYQKNLEPNNSEFISDSSFDEIKEKLESTMAMLNIEYSLENEQELEKFNQHNITENDMNVIDEIEPENYDEESIKRCGGFSHKEESSRMLPRKEFFKNKSTNDGYARICKECYLTLQYGDDRKRKKLVLVPEFDTLVQKWCNRCETVRLHSEFYNDKMTKDGLGANCKHCKNQQKKQYTQRLRETNLSNTEN